MTWLTWPRGRFNGRRIVGIDVRVRVDITRWRLALPNRYGTCLSVGPLHVWPAAAYEYLAVGYYTRADGTLAHRKTRDETT